MPALTRRRSPDAPEECWHVYYGNMHAGTIAIRTGIPHDEDPWEWSCGFYPGSHPGEHTNGTAETFDQARAAAVLPHAAPHGLHGTKGAALRPWGLTVRRGQCKK
jgi:hypothetical protein